MTKHSSLQYWTIGFVVWKDEGHRPGTGLWHSARIMSSEIGWHTGRWSTGGHGTCEAAVESILAYYPNHAIVVQEDDAWIPRCPSCGGGRSMRPDTCEAGEAHWHIQDHRTPFVPCAWFDEVMAYQHDGERYAIFLDTAAKRLQSARLDAEARVERKTRREPLTASQALREAAWIDRPLRISVPAWQRH